MDISIIIPTYNAGLYLKDLLINIGNQTGLSTYEIIIIDSSSIDNTVNIANEMGIKIINIRKDDFNHGLTRTKAAQLAKGKYLIFITQDALPASNLAFKQILSSMERDENIGAVCGRQLAARNADVFAEHLRLFNYPEKSNLRALKDNDIYGSKLIFLSNSFSAYKKDALRNIGWFKRTNFGEDTLACGELLLEGYKVAYDSEAMVIHSHNYSILDECKRYLEIGKLHKRESEFFSKFGFVEKEGFKFIKSELSFLCERKKFYLIGVSCMRNFTKYLTYKIGLLR